MNKVNNPKLHNPIEKHFNNLSPYHYYVFFLLFLSKIPLFWHILSLIFLTPPMTYVCSSFASKDEFLNPSKDICPCKYPRWNTSVFTKTEQTKYGILCETKWLISFSHSMLYLGSLLGSLLFGFLSDKFGRLLMFSLCCFIIAFFGSLVSVMPTIASFIVMRCFEGIGIGGAIVTGYVLCVEYCGIRNREFISALYHIPLNIGHITSAGVSYLLRNCDHFQLAISIPMFLFAFMYFMIMESPKWLMDNEQIDKAVLAMERVLRHNQNSASTIRSEIEEYSVSRAKTSQRKIKFWKIFRHKKLSLNLACMSVLYFVCGMGYYGVSQYIGQMSGNIHINVAVSGALLLPGTIAAVFLLQFLSRRLFLAITCFLSGITMLIVTCIPSNLIWVRVIIACICNCCFFVSFITVFLYGVELFPTTVRNSVLGFLSVMSRLGQIVAPPINHLPQSASGAIFGAMAILGAVLCYPLPETKNVELPSSLEDSKTLPRKKARLGDDTEQSVQIEE